MPGLDDLADRTTLSASECAHLRALVADWQILADLSFSDLVLWVVDAHDESWWAVAQIRPTTGPTTLDVDVVGTRSDLDPAAEARSIGVTFGERRVAVITSRAAPSSGGATSPLEQSYADAADVLRAMVARGEFPTPGVEPTDALRVGDGFIRLDSRGFVSYASPNAVSVYRRFGHDGDLVGENLVRITSPLLAKRPTDRGFAGAFAERESEIEIEGRHAVVHLWIIRLRTAGTELGWIVLLRDVTELRLRERELVSKEATIREIHHRVKNNLQTVAALLRLQGRRLDIPEARHALAEAERRVASIALVHETLSTSFEENVEFDAVCDVLVRNVLDVGGGQPVRAERIGSFGILSADVATPLAMVVTELVHNAIEHAFVGREGGVVTIAVNRIRHRLRLRVSDDGIGLPEDFDPARSLGLSIVSTLVEGELGGRLEFERSRGGQSVQAGASVTVELHV